MHYPENSLEAILKAASVQLQKKLPFVLYRKPGANQLGGLFQDHDELYMVNDFTEQGFVFAPFDTTKEMVVLKPNRKIAVGLRSLDGDRELDVPSLMGDDNAEASYLKKVDACIKEIKKGELKKVVFSRPIQVETKKTPLAIFETALSLYPNAFCYFFYHPKVGTWLGATPETLLRVENQHLETVSLAGTSAGQNPQWTQKELEEQQMVTDFIVGTLSDKTSKLTVSETTSIRAGKLWHLHTRVWGKLLERVSLGDVVTALHPTPAVCGLPRNKAKTVIASYEGYNRSYYTGFLGELNLDGSGTMELYVNLRCMQLIDNGAILYVGGGLTEASDPMAEWQETQNKSRTMLRLL